MFNCLKIVSEAKYKTKNGERLKLLETLQRLPIALAQVKTGSTSENLLNENRQITCFFQEKEITKNVYNNILNSMKV